MPVLVEALSDSFKFWDRNNYFLWQFVFLSGLKINYFLCGPKINYFFSGPKINYFLCGPRINYFLCGPKINYFLCGPKVNYFLCGPKINYILCGPKINYFLSGPKINYVQTFLKSYRTSHRCPRLNEVQRTGFTIEDEGWHFDLNLDLNNVVGSTNNTFRRQC